ncbi:uncharacterized protein N7498_002080 [Penicillium cinerascens]|uniref:Eukaryotic translation initiation factor 5A n=1 Tax=Penicillium cinerascens TaxID=70096 RepID=A0A9W9TAJ3_9EURO|nr:uncharacterized protein N7498_002080 [Penicillium cinerascens]KAJ5215673.1 hypothetical protein N7498_002080 [Penicillium cinerascens]
MSSTSSVRASSLRKNGYIVINGRPGKIYEISMSNEKCHFEAIDIFTDKKLDTLVAKEENVDVPEVSSNEYQFSHIEGGMLHLICMDGAEKNDVPVPDGDVGGKIRAHEDAGIDTLITVISAMGEKRATAVKEAQRG